MNVSIRWESYRIIMSVNVDSSIFTESQVLSKEASELVIPICSSAKEIQLRGQVSEMEALPSLELLGILWVLELRSSTHPSMMH